MNIGKYLKTERAVCKFYLKGICRFGPRCWNLHSSPEKPTENDNQVESVEPTQQDGACALAPSSYSKSVSNSNKQNVYGPSTSTVEEAISLVKIAESCDKTCGICFDTILQKTIKKEQKFGILPNCNHCFCFNCIQKWRQTKEFELDVSKACPECRITSDFVYQSNIWIDDKDEKEEFINSRRKIMKKIDCKYFKKGKGGCPFGNTCLYLHALPNGQEIDVGPPQPRRKRHSRNMSEADVLHQILFWINDEEELEEDIESDGEIENFDELDLDDPLIAMQYYDHDDVRRLIAMEEMYNDYDPDDFAFEMED